MGKFTKRRQSDYSRGTKWGRKTIKKAYREDGKVGLSRCDKSAITCKNYGTNRKIKKNKKGKALTEPFRAYYRGIANGMLLGYNDLFYNNSPTVSKKKKMAKKPIYDAMNDFDYTESGRIKGSYVDGRFEPD